MVSRIYAQRTGNVIPVKHERVKLFTNNNNNEMTVVLGVVEDPQKVLGSSIKNYPSVHHQHRELFKVNIATVTKSSCLWI